MKDKRTWFFKQIKEHVAGFEKKLLEEINALEASVAEHTRGLEILTAANECEHIRKQFNNIIDKHGQELKTRNEALEGARESFKRVLDLENAGKTIRTEEVIDILAAILQLEYKEEGEQTDA